VFAAAAVVVAGAVSGLAHGHGQAEARVTVFGDSAATAMAYDPEAKRILGRAIDLRLEVAACRRVGEASCPYDGVRPPNVIERATELGRELGSVVVVIVGYNDYENTYADNMEKALATFQKAGVERVLWVTLRAERQSYVSMNEAIQGAARRFPQLSVLDWNAVSRSHADWLQPDGIHLTPEGARGMASMVNDALVELGVAPKAPAPKLRAPLKIASQALPVGRRGKPYSGALRATGGAAPYRWTRLGGSLAPGLRLRPTGRLEGAPRRVGTFTLNARVVDRSGTARARVFRLRVL
jgi:hypothetical protein